MQGSYNHIVNVQARDIDTDTDFLAAFDNVKRLWTLEIPGSEAGAVSPADKAAFFKSEPFKQVCRRAGEVLQRAYDSCQKLIMPEVSKGNFIDVDEIKLEAILDMLRDPSFMGALKLGKYAK